MWNKFARWEVIVVAVISVVIVMATVAPFVYGWLATSPGYHFTGRHLNDYEDQSTYVTWIEQARQGNWLLSQIYSSEDKNYNYFNPIFLVLGWLAKLTGLSSPLVFYLAKAILSLFFLGYLYYLLSLVLTKRSVRLICFILISCGSGLGWFVPHNSIDLNSAESTVFFNMYESILNIFGLLCMMVTLHLFASLSKPYEWLKYLAMSLCCGLLILTHTYDIVQLYVVLLAVTVYFSIKQISKVHIQGLLYLSLGIMPFFVLIALMLNNNLALAVWAFQQTKWPAIYWAFYASTFGLLGICALVGYFFDEQLPLSFKTLLLSLVIVVFLCVMNPFSDRYQQKFLLGVFIPFGLLAGLGFNWLLDHVKTGIRLLYFPVLILGMVVFVNTNLTLLSKDMKYFYLNPFPLYIPNSALSAFEFVEQNISPDKVILASPSYANLLPAYTARRVFYGHYSLTIDNERKKDASEIVVNTPALASDPLHKFLADNGIDYLFVDKNSQYWFNFQWRDRQYLKPVYSSGQFQIFSYAP